MSCSCSTLSFDENQWVINIGRALEKELEDDNDDPVCIFTVPKTLMSSHPESYTPQQLSLGPYHYSRPDLHEMERYKLSAAKKLQNQLRSRNFEHLVEELMKLEQKIRACYHKYFNYNAETLAWMMALDVSFLLEFLQIYSLVETKMVSTMTTSRMSHLLDYSKRKSAHHVLLRDMVMLENQVPLFILRKVLEFQQSSAESSDCMLLSMVRGLAKDLSPFKKVELPKSKKILEHSHLLDILYDIIVPKVEESIEVVLEEVVDQIEADQQESNGFSFDSNYVKELLKEIWKIVSQLKIRPVRLINKVSSSVTIKLKFSWTIVSRLLHISDDLNGSENEGSNDSINMPPLVEEITIPSVTQLSNSGVSFIPTKGNISTINFNNEKAAFYLPTINVDLNSEVMFRNLIAYEISNASGPLIFTRYIELMNGIIDTGEDVRLLREKGIIINRLKSDEEVANMLNGMNDYKAIRLTKAPIDKVIEDVNKYHDSRWMVKIRKFMKRSVLFSWQYLTVFAAILLFVLLAMESFCSVFTCSRIFHVHYIFPSQVQG
ncbi:unnamed protein product [Dovyalis caffra]|uniref:Uncharacterized protein n=1 Tax=Dovyalis caffra TaxID=77055 RepID=A0AAV1SVV0_9ROSI|nr:unnamed protein product [Dovyalis caffra]